VSIAEGQERLAELVRGAAAGDDVVIELRDGTAVRLVPVVRRSHPRPSQARGANGYDGAALAPAGDFAPYEP
jgi:antitoxin (DNA-binding transcriptional repressor) of toxin-antitoxin stability system